MWIFTDFGFFSIVAHRSREGVVLVRGRVEEDLREFAKRAGSPEGVFEDQWADYRYRLEVPSEVAAKVISDEMKSMDYDNFKAHVSETQGLGRESIYAEVWATLNRYLR